MTGHWVTRWIGTPWVPGISDCWSLARTVWAKEFGRSVAPLPVDPLDLRAAARVLDARGPEWIPVDRPADGDGVLMARGRFACHVGIWVAPDRVLHAAGKPGALCTPAGRIAETGYRIVAVLRRADWDAP